MVKHVILWQLKEDLSDEKKEQIKNDMKIHLEALVGVVDGLKSLTIVTDGLASSNADVMLDSELESVEALEGYQVHKEHVKVAETYVKPFAKARVCMDYEV